LPSCGNEPSNGWDPDQQDPHVFGPPRSESVSHRYRSGS
jgi:hypothetical protein